MARKTYGAFEDCELLGRDENGRPIVANQTFNKRKGSFDFEGSTKRRFALGDSIKTFRSGR